MLAQAQVQIGSIFVGCLIMNRYGLFRMEQVLLIIRYMKKLVVYVILEHGILRIISLKIGVSFVGLIILGVIFVGMGLVILVGLGHLPMGYIVQTVPLGALTVIV
jgi:hypothetical protein